MHSVLKNFYPFIKHDPEKIYKNFFDTIIFITQSKAEINVENDRKWIFIIFVFAYGE